MEIIQGHKGNILMTSYPLNFDETAVARLDRHKTPWTWLLVIGGAPLPQPQRTDSFFERIQNEKPEKLKERFKDLTEEAKEVVKERNALKSKE